ncbi:MAG: hypothetical protein NTX59_00440 [Elusimicrobia bacterium]|nr:hypothetical protein [Elusimicrobiota bacterium]
MKSLYILICSFLISVYGSANAAGKYDAFESLTKEARGLGAAEAAPAVSAPEVPTWQSETVETPGAGEQNFWDDLYDNVMKKDICENILHQIPPVEYGMEHGLGNAYGADITGTVTGSANRRFHRYADKTLALVDEASLKFEFGAEKTLLDLSDLYELPENAGAAISITGGVRLEGSSMVIRPLGGTKACKELPQILNAFTYKTVLPFKAERFAAMQNGEVWKIPVVLWVGFSPTVSGGYGPASVSVSFGVENQRLPTISLAKMSDKELRVRLRIDQARIISYGASVGVTITPVVTGLDNLSGALTSQLGNFAGTVAANAIAKRFEEYTYASMGISHSNTKGKRVLLEFVLNPQNKGQMDILVKLLTKGELSNIGALAKLALGVNLLPGHNSTTDETELQAMQAEWNQKLGLPPTYSGQNGYKESATEFTIHVPVITDYSHTHTHNYQTVHTPGSNETLHVHQQSRETAHDLIHIPFVGTVARHNTEREVTVFNKETDGKVSAPVMVYEQKEGEIRHTKESAREMLNSVNEIMRFVGTQGEGGSSTAAIPLDAIQPTQGPDSTADGEKHYKATFMAFAINFNENAVANIIAAPANILIKAFANSLDEASRAIMTKVLSVSTIGADGKIKNKQSDLERVLGASLSAVGDNQNNSVMSQISSFCRTATQLVTDIIKIRTAGDWKAQANMLSKVISGGGKCDLKYEAILKVLVQVVSPGDVSAELLYQAEKKAGDRNDISVQYSYNADNPSFASVDGAKETMDHYESSQLSD